MTEGGPVPFEPGSVNVKNMRVADAEGDATADDPLSEASPVTGEDVPIT